MLSGEGEIIVFADDASMSQAIVRLPSAVGWKSRSFTSAEALLASGECVGAAVLIFAIQRPGTSGLELHRQRTAGGPVAPVVFIAAQDRAETRQLARPSGAAAYPTKPFAGSELIQAIHHHLPAA